MKKTLPVTDIFPISSIKISLFVFIIAVLIFYMVPVALSQDIGAERRRLIQEQQKREFEERQKKYPERFKPRNQNGSFTGGTAPAAQPSQSEVKPNRETEESSGVKQPSDGSELSTDASKKVPKAPQVINMGDSISFFFDDADVFEVAQTVFGEVLKLNYIIDPKVKGRVNFRTVAPIPKSEILSVMDIIFRLNGMGFVEEGGLYRIVPLEDVPKELVYAQVGKDPDKVAIELFTFKNLHIKDSLKDIENAIGLSVNRGKIRVLPIYRLNALLVVASTKEQLDYVRKWVETFDNLFSGARPNVYVYSVQNSKAIDVANMLQEIFLGVKSTASSASSKSAQTPSKTSESGQTAAASGQTAPASSSPSSRTATQAGEVSLVSEITKIIPNEVTNSIIILATPEDYVLISDTITKIDIVPRQVMIEALVAEIKLTDDMTFGLSWSLKTDVKLKGMKPFEKGIDLDGTVGYNSSRLSGLDVTSIAGFAFAGVDSAGAARLLLESLAADSKVKILASPNILVSDNREAKIQVGDQVPIATSQTNVTGTTDIQTTIQYKDTGVILKVKPQINESGLVALDISQEVSDFSIKKILGSDQVVISKREATTNLVAQDGETIVIGGLINEKSTKSRDGVPFLSKIPLLGYLFGSTTDNFERTELVILLTPHVIRNQAEAAKVSSGYLQRIKKADKEFDINKFGITNNTGQQSKPAEDAGSETSK